MLQVGAYNSLMTSRGPLDGLTVLDLTRVLAGPYCTMLLGDMGARVIKIEQPGHGDDTRAWGPPFVEGRKHVFSERQPQQGERHPRFQVARGPRHPRPLDRRCRRAGRELPARDAGTDWSRLRLAAGRYTRVSVYCSISGFGQHGPRASQPGYDAVVQAEGGLMSITGEAGGPPLRLGVAIADLTAGLLAAHGITLALFARERSGRGQYVDVALFDAVIALLSYQASAALNGSTAASAHR